VGIGNEVGNRKNDQPELMDQVGFLWEFTPRIARLPLEFVRI
jgi:hypothetical protein